MKEEKLKILIVEDSRLNQEILRKILSKKYKLTIASNGDEALESVKTEHPDLILLDIILPGMDGFDLLAELKNCDNSRSIPVIIISGRSNPDDEVKGLTLGAVDYITKPFHEIVVTARVETHIKILKQMRLIEEFGFIDTLTSIPNRRQFDKVLIKEWNRAKREKEPLSLLMIDVDHFKIYNDTHGHQQGDVALQTVAGTIVSSLKRKTDFAARWGGEEFAVLLPNTTTEGAIKVAEEIRANIESASIPSSTGDTFYNVTISTGVSQIHPEKFTSITDLIQDADIALYKAKDMGRNRVCADASE